jgi:hypothetical protein
MRLGSSTVARIWSDSSRTAAAEAISLYSDIHSEYVEEFATDIRAQRVGGYWIAMAGDTT